MYRTLLIIKTTVTEPTIYKRNDCYIFRNSLHPFLLKDPSAMPRPTSQDLAGFWDLLQLSIDDVTMKFDQLQQIKNNNWRPIDSPEKKVRDSLKI